MELRRLEVGALGVCCYLVAANKGGGCVVIDPGGDAETIAAELRGNSWTPELVLLTHAHCDHIGGVAELLAAYPGAVLASSAETGARAQDPRLNLSVFLGQPIACPPPGRTFADGETFAAAGLEWLAREVPGHDPGEMVYYLSDEKTLFAGDAIFAGSVGRSDFPGGDHTLLVTRVAALLKELPPETMVYPGHGPATRAGHELANNPFLQGL